MRINKIPFSNLLKQELPALATRIIDIVDSHNPKVLMIEEVYDLLVAQKPIIKLLTQPYGSHPITEKLTPARQNCLNYSRSIVYNMNLVVKENVSNQSDAILETKRVITRYLYKLDECRTERLFIKRLGDFFDAVQDDTVVQDALEDFGLSKYINKLLIAFRSLSELLTQRAKSISERPLETTKDHSKTISKSLIDLIMQIEVAALKHTDLDYNPLINELNKAIYDQIIDVNKRLLYNKRKAAGLEESKSNEESTNPEEPTMMMRELNVEPETENGFETGFDEQLDEKKAAATSAKQVQLPSKNDEA